MHHQPANTRLPVIDRTEEPERSCPQTNEDLRKKNMAAIALLDSFLLDDATEQGESWAYLKHALDEDRAEGQKLFS